ncbi:GDP-mannose 4,6-dehydratase [Candidatus Pacearchaeota archaeon]|nr:GDP-mannose 4,6-dehydratase [Candidatus Pacearchaeota archaeon]
MGKKALITGITGQDGSYLAEFLLEKGYEVHGLVRRLAIENPSHRLNRINHILDKIELHSGTLENYSRFIEIFEDIKPDECYHLAAQSFVHESFEDGFSTMEMNIKGVQHALSALNKKTPNCKFYFAATSEMFGKVQEIPQKETTPFHPRSPYGISKVTGFHLTRNYREAYDLFACSGILFNHESPRRGFEFVTRKITDGLAKIKLGLEDSLSLGNLDAKRDWGFAGDYVEAMWMMLQQEKPKDYVIATGKTHTVREFIEKASDTLNMKINWEDKGLNEKGYNENGKKIIEINPKFYRPAEVKILLGDPSKAKKELGWEPKTNFDELVEMMVKSDLERLSGK